MVIIIMSVKLKFLFKQLFPLKYKTKYRNSNYEEMYCSWRMWLGKPFHIKQELK